jgi:large subunit ribosomal protein L31e
MAEKKESTKIEREYTIPLREKGRSVVKYKKTPKAVKTVKEFVAKHMKVENRDLNKVKLDKYLNEALWSRGIKNPIHKIKVKVVKEGEIVRVYAIELPTNLHHKKKREDKKSQEQKKIGEKKKKELEAEKKEEEKADKETDKDKDGVEDKVEEKEKETATKEVAQKEMKKEAKENAEAPKKGKEKIAELRKEDKTSRGH